MGFKVGDKVQPNACARKFLAPTAISVPSVVVSVGNGCVRLEGVKFEYTPDGVPEQWLEPFTAVPTCMVAMTENEAFWLPMMLMSALTAYRDRPVTDDTPVLLKEAHERMVELTSNLLERVMREYKL